MGGVARFISDDGYLVGPPGEVTQAFNSFKDAIERNCGLTLQTNKCKLLVGSGSRLEDCCPGVALVGLSLGGGWEPGFICVGVPIESNGFVRGMMDRKLTELEDKVDKAL